MTAEYGVVKGLMARFTLTDGCGMPIAGPRSRIVSKAFVTATGSPQMRERQDIEQNNADGSVGVSDSTRAQRKWWNVAFDFSKINTDVFNMLLDWELILGYDGSAIGVGDVKETRPNRAVMVELWSGVGADDECDDVPTTDDILTSGVISSANTGYTAWCVKEFALSSDYVIGESVSTFSATGRTVNATRWGRGPYNVMPIDAQGTPGRLLKPIPVGRHITTFETSVPFPEPTGGACPLILPSPYYGLTAAETAPEQPACDAVGTNEEQSVTVTGSPTGGTFTLALLGYVTTSLAYNAATSVVQAALEALGSIGTGNVTVTGTPGDYDVEFVGELAGVNLPTMVATASLTGGTTPGVTVTTTQQGGVY